jgi:hypothetical protein
MFVPCAHEPRGSIKSLPESRAGTKSASWLEVIGPLGGGPNDICGGPGPSAGAERYTWRSVTYLQRSGLMAVVPEHFHP